MLSSLRYSNGPSKSFQAPLKEKMATVIKPGFVNGTMICHQICKWPAPSRIAASISSSGMANMNWRSKKMKKALPRKAGTINGKYVFTQPSLENRIYCGTIVTKPGISMVESAMTKKGGLHLNLIFANAYATREFTKTLPKVAIVAMKIVFIAHLVKGAVCHASR